MKLTRRDFIRDGVAAFTVGFAAPAFLTDLARAQGSRGRNLVVLYLSGGNDALSTLISYTDPFYYSRRPTIAVPAATVLQIGTDSSGLPLGLHPQLTGLKTIWDEGRLALVQRAGYQNSSRSHFLGTDIWSTANPNSSQGPGWLGRYLDALPDPVDPLIAWNTLREVPRSLLSRTVSIAAIPNVAGYTFASPNTGAEAGSERTAALRIASHVPVDRPHLAFVNDSALSAMATLDRVAAVGTYQPTVTYPTDGFGQALRAIAGAMAKQIGTQIYWVQTGGYDTHAQQNPVAANGAYTNLMRTLNNGVSAFYRDLTNLGLLNDTLIVQFSEFGRRIGENGSTGTDHGAAGLMMLIGGMVRGGLYGTAASLQPDPQNPTLENNGNDVRHETDFRSVYAQVIDNWLGADSGSLLGGNFRRPDLQLM
ncbi:MAG: DUF1501 domain-containing protein [Acidobacteria bacterium]|nr:DUF1501 domain-containing protein [Acidobacteriota bacterium]